jgi:hypothetical protein
MTPEQPGWFQCRRFKSCRARLPAHELHRDEATGDLYCMPGKCPSGAGPGTSELITKDLELRQAKDRIRALERDKNQALAMLGNAETRLQTALSITSQKSKPVKIEKPEEGEDGRSETVPILLCSDWHFGSVVKPETVNHLNEYNVDIAHGRAAALFRNVLKITAMLRSTADVKQMIIWLGGDLIDNWIHPEQAQTQELSPTQQLIEVEKAIIGGIDHLLEFGDFEELLVPCSYGNHGRTTQKMQSNGHQTSYEWLMYQSLQRHYRKNDRVKFIIAETNSLYIDVFGHSLRFMHGDCVKYHGGVGGVHVPLMKWLDRTNRTIRADHTFLGHFHQIIMGSSYSVNSCLCGAMAYGMRNGYGAEPPQQLLRCIDSKRGFTIAAPVFVE